MFITFGYIVKTIMYLERKEQLVVIGMIVCFILGIIVWRKSTQISNIVEKQGKLGPI